MTEYKKADNQIFFTTLFKGRADDCLAENSNVDINGQPHRVKLIQTNMRDKDGNPVLKLTIQLRTETGATPPTEEIICNFQPHPEKKYTHKGRGSIAGEKTTVFINRPIDKNTLKFKVTQKTGKAYLTCSALKVSQGGFSTEDGYKEPDNKNFDDIFGEFSGEDEDDMMISGVV